MTRATCSSRATPLVAAAMAALVLAGCGRSVPRHSAQPVTAQSARAPDGSAPPASATAAPGARSSSSGAGASGGPSARPSTSRSPRPGALPSGVIRRTGSAAVALTFDDGPDPVNTPALLDVLRRHGVKATFCVVGSRARDYPAVVARIHAEGHALCNHTWQHLGDFTPRDDGYVKWDLSETNKMILAAAPGARITHFRAPFGNFTTRLNGFAAELGMKPVMWDVDDECWRTDAYGTGPRMVEHMVKQVRTGTRHGSIILSHENKKPFTAIAYDTLLPWLKARFELVTLT